MSNVIQPLERLAETEHHNNSIVTTKIQLNEVVKYLKNYKKISHIFKCDNIPIQPLCCVTYGVKWEFTYHVHKCIRVLV